jgi:hypothetical protein
VDGLDPLAALGRDADGCVERGPRGNGKEGAIGGVERPVPGLPDQWLGDGLGSTAVVRRSSPMRRS